MRTTLRELREKAGLTQEQLAEKAGVARQTILFLEKAQYNPSLRLASKIARILKAPIEEIFSYDDEF